jgi:hypothetical protein
MESIMQHIYHRPRELAHRRSSSLDVTLLWSAVDGAVTVSVMDIADSRAFSLAVPPCDALDAFRHPFAYAARAQPAHADLN